MCVEFNTDILKRVYELQIDVIEGIYLRFNQSMNKRRTEIFKFAESIS